MKRKQCFIGICFLILIFIFVSCASNPSLDEYTIDNDSVASITSVVGERHLYEYSDDIIEKDGMKSKVYRYKYVRDVQDDLLQYIDYLQEHSFESLMTTNLSQLTGLAQFGRVSTMQDKAFVITISFYEKGYDIQVDVADGQIKTYDI